ncbi:MAG: hypothetical protein QG656_1563 [Candidatus Hydrogenedentes bacterium]|nr:hypothetical protein [Candidatus Hydrogenedentota bacterium]
MKRGVVIRLTGVNVHETGKTLVRRLVELGGNAECVDDTVTMLDADSRLESRSLDVEVAEYDTPDFAAEKILDQLSELGLVDLENTGYTPEEEERIRARLADLGYID